MGRRMNAGFAGSKPAVDSAVLWRYVTRMVELLGLVYSPWSEKARFALDVRRVPYVFRHYKPVIGEPALRWRLGRLTGTITVPVLKTDDGQLLADSTTIARWADRHGEGPRLFPAEHASSVEHFIALSERAMSAGRARQLTRMLDDDEALAEMVPKSVRRAIGPLAAGIGRSGVRRTLRKYGGDQRSLDEHRATMTAALDDLRDALAKTSSKESPRSILDHFSFADITMAQALAFVEPPASGLKLGRASRRYFHDGELAETYRDLVEWRDAVYAKYRLTPPSAA